MIEVQNLVKYFGAFPAVEGVSFSVAQGEVLGFLGPNGAGKSTTMKMITGFLVPTEGEVGILGRDMLRNPLSAQKLVGYLPEGAPAYAEMTPRQFLGFAADARGLEAQQKTQAIGRAVELIELEGVMEQPIETLSKGFKRRVGLAQAILHDPPVLIMDEPTDGLDPNQKHAVRELIGRMAADKAIIISTHILEEVEAVCSRAMVIARGSIVADGTPAELMARSRYHGAVSVVVDDAVAEKARQLFRRQANIQSHEERPMPEARLAFTLFPRPGRTILDGVLSTLKDNQIQVHDIASERGRLEDVFKELTMDVSASAQKVQA